MLKKLNALLKFLPFDGDKLKLSVLLLMAGNVPGLDLKELFLMVVENPTKAGLVAALIALVHKIIKANLPRVENPK